ncbi:dephospho-CoA kinase [soil metagenome]
MQKVGLTGSIAVGKSFVCEVLRELGCHVLDADKTSREVVEPGTPGLNQIIANFGDDILLPDGTLDRKRMGAIVFADAEKRQLLNSIVHPFVIGSQNNWIAACEKTDANGIAIIDAALLIESGGYRRFDKLIVVWCEPAIQLKRLTLRDNLPVIEAQQRIAAQMSQDEKISFADYLIDTSDGFESTRTQTESIVKKLKEATT